MNKFNKLYEDIFKPASPEEVKERQEQSKVEKFKDWVERAGITYETLFNKENINKQDERGYTTLMIAILDNLIELAKLLIDKGADVNIENEFGDTALIYISDMGNLELAKLLLDKGADINVKNNYGVTPLMNASINDNIEMAKFLLDNGADVNAKNNNGNTALSYAVGNKDIIKLLRQYGDER